MIWLKQGTIPSRFRKNRDNGIFIFQETPITWISPSNKSADSEKSHQVVTRYVVNLSYFELGDKKIPGMRDLVTAGDLIFLR